MTGIYSIIITNKDAHLDIIRMLVDSGANINQIVDYSAYYHFRISLDEPLCTMHPQKNVMVNCFYSI